jgi:hypothetical protein
MKPNAMRETSSAVSAKPDSDTTNSPNRPKILSEE